MTSAVLERALGEPFAGRAAAVGEWMRRNGKDQSSLEASIRVERGLPRGLRMMVEAVSPESARSFFDALDAPWTSGAEALRDAAAGVSAQMIVGWDHDAPTPSAKLYANLSDASEARRRAIATQLSLPFAPHVVGLNVGYDRSEASKLYAQTAERPPLAIPALLLRLAERGLGAGWVVSSTWAGERLVPRAVFLAVRAATEGPDELESEITPWPAREALDAVAPFPIGALRSVGVDLEGKGVTTVYFKPAGVRGVAWDLEPVLVASAPEGEVGLFVEPASLGRRAWATVGPHALSYREREGDVPRERLLTLLAWARTRLEAGVAPADLWRDAAPPLPWSVSSRG